MPPPWRCCGCLSEAASAAPPASASSRAPASLRFPACVLAPPMFRVAGHLDAVGLLAAPTTSQIDRVGAPFAGEAEVDDVPAAAESGCGARGTRRGFRASSAWRYPRTSPPCRSWTVVGTAFGGHGPFHALVDDRGVDRPARRAVERVLRSPTGSRFVFTAAVGHRGPSVTGVNAGAPTRRADDGFTFWPARRL